MVHLVHLVHLDQIALRVSQQVQGMQLKMHQESRWVKHHGKFLIPCAPDLGASHLRRQLKESSFSSLRLRFASDQNRKRSATMISMKIMRFDNKNGKQSWKRRNERKKKRCRKTSPTLVVQEILAGTSFKIGLKLTMTLFGSHSSTNSQDVSGLLTSCVGTSEVQWEHEQKTGGYGSSNGEEAIWGVLGGKCLDIQGAALFRQSKYFVASSVYVNHRLIDTNQWLQ